jgi:hypothetical protein
LAPILSARRNVNQFWVPKPCSIAAPLKTRAFDSPVLALGRRVPRHGERGFARGLRRTASGIVTRKGGDAREHRSTELMRGSGRHAPRARPEGDGTPWVALYSKRCTGHPKAPCVKEARRLSIKFEDGGLRIPSLPCRHRLLATFAVGRSNLELERSTDDHPR